MQPKLEPTQGGEQDKKQANKRTLRRLLLASLGMFAFGFLLVPLYDVFCQITGLNGKTGAAVPANQSIQIDQTRWITVQFLTNTNADMPWLFEPLQHKVKVHPGEITKVGFSVLNPALRPMTAQAVPSVSPSEGAEYLLKTQCFCFEQQTLAAGAHQEMTLLFRVDPNLPSHIHTLTLAYTLFDISETNAIGQMAQVGINGGLSYE